MRTGWQSRGPGHCVRAETWPVCRPIVLCCIPAAAPAAAPAPQVFFSAHEDTILHSTIMHEVRLAQGTLRYRISQGVFQYGRTRGLSPLGTYHLAVACLSSTLLSHCLSCSYNNPCTTCCRRPVPALHAFALSLRHERPSATPETPGMRTFACPSRHLSPLALQYPCHLPRAPLFPCVALCLQVRVLFLPNCGSNLSPADLSKIKLQPGFIW